MYEKLIFIIYRILFTFACLMLFFSIWDRTLRMFDLTLTWIPYEPARLLEHSSILMIFVIALLLRQIRNILNKEKIQ